MDKGNRYPEESQAQRHHVHQRDGARGAYDNHPKLVGDLDQADPVCHEHAEQGAERQADRLEHDAVVLGLEDRGQTADRESLERRVDRRRDRCPVLLEDRHQRRDEAAEHAAQHPGHRGLHAAAHHLAPHPRSRHHDEQQQESRLVDGAFHGHRLAGGYLAGAAELLQDLGA